MKSGKQNNRQSFGTPPLAKKGLETKTALLDATSWAEPEPADAVDLAGTSTHAAETTTSSAGPVDNRMTDSNVMPSARVGANADDAGEHPLLLALNGGGIGDGVAEVRERRLARPSRRPLLRLAKPEALISKPPNRAQEARARRDAGEPQSVTIAPVRKTRAATIHVRPPDAAAPIDHLAALGSNAPCPASDWTPTERGCKPPNRSHNRLTAAPTIAAAKSRSNQDTDDDKISGVQAPADAEGRDGSKSVVGGSKKLGAGFMGSVFFPPPPCQDAGLDREIERISRHTPLVLKHTELAMGLTAVHTSNYIRDRWEKLRRVRYHTSMAPSLWALLHEVRTKQPDEFFVLSLSQVCSNCLTPDGSQPLAGGLTQEGAMVGIYMPHAGRKFTEVLPPGSPLNKKEMRIVRHTIGALLLLHGLGITHNDVRRANITIDAQGTPRLIDWELRSRPRSQTSDLARSPLKETPDVDFGSGPGAGVGDGAELYVDALPSDRRVWQAFVHGFFATPRDLVRLDWNALARVFAVTWEQNLASHPPEHAKLLTQILRLLRSNSASDRDALLAWTVLTHALD
jgi:hypothetical protein